MNSRGALLGLVGLLFSLSSCGGDSPGGVTGGTDSGIPAPGTPIALADLCSVFTTELCQYMIQCSHAAYRDIDHCRAETDCYGVSDLAASVAGVIPAMRAATPRRRAF